jgi:hypothetical protein
MKRLLAIALVVGVGMAGLGRPGVSFAAAPDRFEGDYEGGVPVVTMRCGFPVLREFEGRVITLTWTEADGEIRQLFVSPTFRVRLTNPATSKTIVVTSSGPFLARSSPDGSSISWFAGPSFSSYNPETGAFGLFVFAGRLFTEVDATGAVTRRRFVGRVRDLCSELASP